MSGTEIEAVMPKSRKLRNNLVAYSFIAPNFIGFAIFTLIPVFMAVALSFMKWNGSAVQGPQFIGLQNYLHMFSDKRFMDALINTIIYTAVTVPLTMICSLLLAVILNQKIFGRNFFRTMSFFPYVASLVAVAAVWNALFSPEKGPVNELLRAIGIADPPGWAVDPNWAMVTLIMFSIWKNMGYYMIIYLAGLQGISPDLYEAAGLDGANIVQKFRYVTLPQLSSTNFLVLIMITIQCFKVYDIVLMITNAGPGTKTLVLVFHIYNVAFKQWDLGYASAISMVLFLMVLAVTLVQFYGKKKMSN